MTTPDPPAPYRVVYSQAVLREIRKLVREAKARGDGPACLAALEEIQRRLVVFPQFGDPIIDMAQGGGQIRLGIVRPISLRYGVHEESRTVFCGTPPVLLPMDRPET